MRITTADEPERVVWDPDDKASVRKAYRRYAKLRRDGRHLFCAVEEAGLRKISRFDKRLDLIFAFLVLKE